MRFVRICFLSLLLAAATQSAASEQPPMLDEADAVDLIGGSVQSPEGIEVGEVSAVLLKADGAVVEIRMTMEQSLGIGEKTVILPRNSFLVLRGAVVLQLPLDEIRRLPTVQRSR